MIQTVKQQSQQQNKERPIEAPPEVDDETDPWIDRCLDWLREHRFPPAVEVIASWQVACGCIVYYGYGYLRSILLLFISTTTRRSSIIVPVVPLTTEPRRRKDRFKNGRTGDRQYLVLIDELGRFLSADDDDDDELVATIRSDLTLRRLVSRFVTATTTTTRSCSTAVTSTNSNSSKNNYVRDGTAADDDDTVATLSLLRSRLLTVWPRLVEFPPLAEAIEMPTTAGVVGTTKTTGYDISLIVPSYREASARIVWTLDMALRHCHDPHRVQVIIVTTTVDNDTTTNNGDELRNMLVKAGHIAADSATAWGDVTIAPFDHRTPNRDDGTAGTTTTTCTGGRGPVQNYGARLATGTLLTFLHADTIVPIDWDRKVQETLLLSSSSQRQLQQQQDDHHPRRRIVQACAFTFGHNTEQLDDMPYPWGIRAVWLLGNLRAYLFRLPYGDHVISIPASYFRYLGGFPDQPIMEDYDLMDLLRKRAAAMKWEGIRIIAPPTARCSVRRWQRFGTVYVTLVNALLVHRYSQGGWSADDVYEYYYERPVVVSTSPPSTIGKGEKEKAL